MKTQTAYPMKSPVFFILTLVLAFHGAQAQNLQVSTIVEDINASGGVTWGPDGNIYVSDFAPSFSPPTEPTSVFKVNYGNWEVSEFAMGFDGASGACFDQDGNFYQSNPFGHKISKVSVDGTVEIDWAIDSLGLPVGIQQGFDGNFYVCDCSLNKIMKVTPEGEVSTFIDDQDRLKCPNGLAMDPDGYLYACNFQDGKIFKIDLEGNMTEFTQIPQLFGGPNPVGAGHLVWKNNFFWVTAIGRGEIYKVDMEGNKEKIAGVANAFTNIDGPALQATFSKPNGIAASYTGDTLFVNVTENSWVTNPSDLHPMNLRMITGVCSLPDVACELSSNASKQNKVENLFTLSPNPVEDTLFFALNEGHNLAKFELTFLNNYGEKVKNIIIHGKSQLELSVKDLPAGIYHLHISGDNVESSKSVIIK